MHIHHSQRLKIYTENASKNRSGCLTQLNLENKIVKIIAHPEAGEYCHCYLLDSKLPSKAKEMDIFYVRTLMPKDKSSPWFSHVAVGKNKLASVITEMCRAAGIKGHAPTNHSLRVTGATQLYNAVVAENYSAANRSPHSGKSSDIQMY